MPFRVLVVCSGNMCRSPLAERLLRSRLDDLVPDRMDKVHVYSAGVRAWAGRPMDAHSAAELVRLGGDPAGFVSNQLTDPMVEQADLVLAATLALRSRVLEDEPRALRRAFTLLELAALVTNVAVTHDPADLVVQAARRRSDVREGDYDIPDPIGQSLQVHRQVADLLDHSCTTIARALAASLTDT